MVSGNPLSANSSSLGLMMVCSIITPSVGQRLVGLLEEVVVAVAAEVLERADRHDAVDRLVELLPTLSSTRFVRGLVESANSFSTWACWFLLSVSPTTLTSYFSMARFRVAPQPQPMSSSVIPGLSPSLPSDRSIFAICASSSVMSSRSKYAQL